jgi:hypothetical protein
MLRISPEKTDARFQRASIGAVLRVAASPFGW